MDNTSDAISRIKNWSSVDKDRLKPVEDSRDVDDNSTEVNLTEVINSTDLDSVILEINTMKTSDRVSLNSAILSSWHSTPSPNQLSTLLTMYGNGGWDQDNWDFSKSIYQLDVETVQNWM